MLAGPNVPQGPDTLAGRTTLEAADQTTILAAHKAADERKALEGVSQRAG